MAHTYIIVTEAATFTAVCTSATYPLFDVVNKALVIYADSAHASAIAAFTGVVRYSNESVTVTG